MLIRKVEKNPSHGFDVFIDYYVSVSEDSVEETEIAAWCSHTFSSGFVLLQYASKILAGGCSDNAKGWDEGWLNDEHLLVSGEYQLRCSSEDATIFLLKYNKAKEA